MKKLHFTVEQLEEVKAYCEKNKFDDVNKATLVFIHSLIKDLLVFHNDKSA